MTSRPLRFAPGTDASPNGVLKHDFREEVYILEASLYDIRLTENFSGECMPADLRVCHVALKKP